MEGFIFNLDGYIVHTKLYSINNSYTVSKQYVSHKSEFLNEIIILSINSIIILIIKYKKTI